MKKQILLFFTSALILCGCSADDEHIDSIYRIQQNQVGDYRNLKDDWDNSSKFKNIYDKLSDEYNAFICSTFNYDILDGKRRYEYTELLEDMPIEYDYYGKNIIVSDSYFDFNLIEDINGQKVQDAFIHDPDTLNVLVPLKYQNDEQKIISSYQDFMYFNNVEVDNFYNKELNKAENNKKAEDFVIRIIYVPDNTAYPVYDPRIEKRSIDDCITAVIDSENFHRVQLSALATHSFYISSEYADSSDVEAIFQKYDYLNGFHALKAVSEEAEEFRQEKITGMIVIGVLILICFTLILLVIKLVIKHKRNKN